MEFAGGPKIAMSRPPFFTETIGPNWALYIAEEEEKEEETKYTGVPYTKWEGIPPQIGPIYGMRNGGEGGEVKIL